MRVNTGHIHHTPEINPTSHMIINTCHKIALAIAYCLYASRLGNSKIRKYPTEAKPVKKLNHSNAILILLI